MAGCPCGRITANHQSNVRSAAGGNATIAITPYINSQGLGGRPRGQRDHAVGVYYAGVPITSGKTVQAVALPAGATIPPSGQRIIGLHIFAMGIG